MDQIQEKLPTEKGGPAKTKRGELWKQFNVNGNSCLSLAEVDKGLAGIDIPEISGNKQVVLRAFQAAKGAHNSPEDKDDLGEEYIERSEFRLLFVYLKNYLQLFDAVDSGDDKRINQDNFESAIPTMKQWGLVVKDPKASFAEADANGGGEILFDEFAHWAIQKALHIQIGLGTTSPVAKKRTLGSTNKKRTSAKGGANKPKKKLSAVDWKLINDKLPSSKSDEEKTKRGRSWRSFNVNGNAYLSLAEVDVGLKTLKLPEIANNKIVIIRAFQAAKGIHNAPGKDDIGESYIERSEFRLLFVYLKGYLELWRLFDEVDASKDKKIDKDEFQSAVPTLKKWGISITNAEETFDEVDTNGGGQILFDEFADWSIKKALSVEFQVEMPPPTPKSVPKVDIATSGGVVASTDEEAKMESSSFDWDKIKEKLPAEKTDEQTAQRKELFDRFDPNGNGYLSLAEVQRGCEEIIALPEIYESKPVMMRAFQAAKGVSSNNKSDLGDDYIERSEFRLLLLYLRNYLEVWQVFEDIDTGDDKRIDLKEFRTAIPILEGWGVEIEDPEASFAEIDTNGGGQVLFHEFADWSIKMSLILDLEVVEPKVKDADSFAASLDDILSDDGGFDLDDDLVDEASEANEPLDWDKIKEKLPAEKTEEQTAQRKELFDRFDPNGNGYLSLAEVQRGCEEVIAVPQIYESKPVMMRAFQAAKGVAINNKSDLGDDYIERSEFRLLLLYLRNYLEVWQVFAEIDTGDDKRIDLEEFRTAIPILEGWGVPVEDPEASFAKIDTNGGGQILFAEFADWSIKKALHLEIEVEAPSPTTTEKMDASPSIDEEDDANKPTCYWEKIREKLPSEKNEEQNALRKALFDGFDPNGNGYLSLAEIQRGCEQIIGLPEIYENKPVMMRAYQAARSVANKKSPETEGDGENKEGEDLGEHYVERSEFRLLLLYLRNYLEVWQMFDRIDTGDDRRINLEEFQSAIPLLKTWGVEIEDSEASFAEIDANGGGQILFDEFSHWAIQKGLDLEDDDE